MARPPSGSRTSKRTVSPRTGPMRKLRVEGILTMAPKRAAIREMLSASLSKSMVVVMKKLVEG